MRVSIGITIMTIILVITAVIVIIVSICSTPKKMKFSATLPGLIVGGVLIIAGIPLIVIGARNNGVPDDIYAMQEHVIEVDDELALRIDCDFVHVKIEKNSDGVLKYFVPADNANGSYFRLNVRQNSSSVYGDELYFDIESGWGCGKFFNSFPDVTMIISVPDTTKITNVKAEVNAGSICIDGIDIERDCILEADAGAITVLNCSGRSFTVKADAGDVEIIGAEAKSIDMDVDAGNITFDIKADIINIKVDAGNIKGTIIGRQEDYNIIVDCDLGSCNLHNRGDSSLPKKLRIESDVGNVVIAFSEIW